MNTNDSCTMGCTCCGPWLYTVFRIIVGGLFMWHGIGKLMNWSMLPDVWFNIAGVVETVVGALILLGLYTSMAAVGGAIVMLGAWIHVHLPKGWSPMSNGGELALVYLAAFLVLHMNGNGAFALGNCCKEEPKAMPMVVPSAKPSSSSTKKKR